LQHHLTVYIHLNFTVFRCFFAAYHVCIINNLQFRFRYDYFINHAYHLAAFNKLMHEYHHDFDFDFELCYLFSSLQCIDIHHYVFHLFDYCFQFSIVCIYHFTCFFSCKFNLHLCQIFNFLILWFLVTWSEKFQFLLLNSMFFALCSIFNIFA